MSYEDFGMLAGRNVNQPKERKHKKEVQRERRDIFNEMGIVTNPNGPVKRDFNKFFEELLNDEELIDRIMRVREPIYYWENGELKMRIPGEWEY
jgi:hypothetical protein